MAAALLRGEPLRVASCGLNPLRLGFVRALRSMGAKIELKPLRDFPEPCGEIEVKPSRLKAIRVKPAEIPAMIDEIPLLALLASLARGVTVIGGIEGLRSKESDRVAGTLALLGSLGVKASYKRGALTVTGTKKFTAAGPIRTFNDHRLAMAAGAASAACPGLKIENPACVDKSYPGFWTDFKAVFGR